MVKTSKVNNLIKVGTYNPNFNFILDININISDIYLSRGLKKHLIKRKHFNVLKYLPKIPEIIKNPDYIGINPNEKNESIELIKKYEKNILVGIKIDVANDILYISTIHDISKSKIKRRLHSGRLKKIDI